jgi:hypothetical protein
MIPTQNTGTVIASDETAVTARSVTPPSRTAAAIPAGNPITTARTSAMPAIDRSTGRRCQIEVETEIPVNHERPRSPCTAWPSQLRYCAGNERSSPHRWFSRAIDAGVAVCPSACAAGLAFDR